MGMPYPEPGAAFPTGRSPGTRGYSDCRPRKQGGNQGSRRTSRRL